ncbi:DNA polymerase III subunit delta [Ekhidna sp.]|uniref:DNA polymerase III subunit delta n=1 Tax=Ekhidna sp. TaxID=2608089 RepID=UPI0032EEE8C8
MASDYSEILRDINSGSFAPVYFLQGEETFFIDNIIENIENTALDESQKSFNQIILYGKDTSLTDVIGAARRYPMMGERQVVIVKEAQEMRDWTKEAVQTLVVNYVENPLPSTILVFGYKYKTVDKRTKFGKSIEKNSVFLNAKKLYDNQVPDWIQGYCKSRGVKIDSGAVMMLSENIGNNLQRLANEIEKLLLNVKDGQEVSSAMVQKYVGISKDYNIFELQKALSAMNKLKALKIANYFASNPSNNPLVLTIYSLFSYYSKLLLVHHSQDKNEKTIASAIGVNPFFVKEYLQAARNYPVGKVVDNIKYLHEADMQSKGIGYATKKEGPVLTELVYKLMN